MVQQDAIQREAWMPSEKPTDDGSLGNGAPQGPNVGTPLWEILNKNVGIYGLFTIPKNP